MRTSRRWLATSTAIVLSSALSAGPAWARGHHGGHHASKAPRGSRHGRGRHGAPVAAPVAPAAPAVAATPEEAYKNGLAAFESGDDATAVENLKIAIAAPKPIPLAYFFLGRALGRQTHYPDGRDALMHYLKLEPNGAQADDASKLIHDFTVLEATHISVTSRPDGARFALDKPDGPSVVAPGDLYSTPGPHKLFVTREGYEPQTVDATVTAGEALPVEAALTPVGCDLTVQVLLPATSATLKVDDGDSETAPGPVRVTPGAHEVAIGMAGGESTTRQVSCQKTEPLKVALMAPTPTNGRLSVTLPSGSKLTVDGHEQKVNETRALLDLPPGEHLVDIDAEGKVPWHTAATVHTGETTDLSPTLEAGRGATGIGVTAWPEEATITVDGKPVKSAEVTAVTPGKHRVEVHAAGYFPQSRELDVITGERSHVEVRLERRGRFLLYLGLAAIPIGVAAEGLAIAGHVNAGGELAGSPTYERWHALEVSGHIIAGAAAAVAVGSITGYFLQQRSGGESPARSSTAKTSTPSTSVGAAVDGHGGSVVVSRSF